MTEALALRYKWIKLWQGRKVQYVYVPIGYNPYTFACAGAWVKEKTPRKPRRTRPADEFVLRNVVHIYLEAGESYPCAKCGNMLTFGDRASVATVCYGDGSKYRVVFHPGCVPYKPRIIRTWFKILIDGCYHNADYLQSVVSPAAVPLVEWTMDDAKASEGRADLELLPSEDEAPCQPEVPDTKAIDEEELLDKLFHDELQARMQPRELTNEEIEIASAIMFDKLTWKQCAEKFNLSMSTIQRRIASVERKVGQTLPKRSA
jgi:hypothetical protein